MNSEDFCKLSRLGASRSADPMKAAERELAAFFNAVAQMFGKEQADLSAEDWLQQLGEMDSLPSSTRGWRSITLKALARLQARMGDATPLSAELTQA